MSRIEEVKDQIEGLVHEYLSLLEGTVEHPIVIDYIVLVAYEDLNDSTVEYFKHITRSSANKHSLRGLIGLGKDKMEL